MKATLIYSITDICWPLRLWNC